MTWQINPQQDGRTPDILKKILFYASMAVLISGLFPPWLYTYYETGTRDLAGMRSENDAGYCLIFTPPQPKIVGFPASGVRLDGERLLVEWVCILAVGGLVWGMIRIGKDGSGEMPKKVRELLPENEEKPRKRNGSGREC